MDNNRTQYLKTSSDRFRANKYRLLVSPKAKISINFNELTKLSDICKSTARMSHSSFKPKTIIQLLKSQSKNKQKPKASPRDHHINLFGSKKYRSEDHPLSRQTQREAIQKHDYCQITIFVDSKQIHLKLKVQKVELLLSQVHRTCKKHTKEEIVGFQTLNKNLKMDYFLTCPQADATFLNGSKILLKPIYKEIQEIVGLHSFQIITCVGSGGFSSVFLVRFREDGKFYAMKVIDKNFIVKNKKKKIVMNERNIMAQMSHPLLAKLYFAFESKQNLIFVMEYYPGGQLFGLVKRFRKMDEPTAKFYMIQILLGLEEMHKAGVVYRDFKPENILIDRSGHAHIADFGLAKPNITSIQQRAYSFCGSPEYMPPQMIAKKGHSLPVDFYCLGALFYELVTGLPPFYDKDPQKIYYSTLNEPLGFPKHSADLSINLKQLLTGLLCKDQRRRIGSLFGVKEVLAHPWFGKINKSEYLQKTVQPPVSFYDLDDLKFNSQEMKHENEKLMKDMLKIQKKEDQNYVKVMSNFNYDRRQIQPLSSLFLQKTTLTEEGYENTSRFSIKKRKTQNSQSSRKLLNTSNEKIRKSPYNNIQMRNQISQRNPYSCLSVERLFRQMDNVM